MNVNNREVAEKPVAPPSLWKTLSEVKVVMDIGRAMLPRRRPRRRAQGDPVLVVPGFGTGDGATVVLRTHLEASGFEVHTWNLGINRGPRPGVMRALSERVRAIARASRRPVQLVGWSLGGLMARVVAGRLPETVTRVVALGSPLSADPKSSRLSLIYGAITGRTVGHSTVRSMLRDGARAPVTSIYSRNDGVVAWQASAVAPGECRTCEVDSTHLGMMIDADVHELVAKELSREVA